MRLSWAYRWVAVLSVLLVASGIGLVTAGEAGAAGHNRGDMLSFEGDQAQLVVPVPPCPQSQPACSWLLFVNEPNEHVTVGFVTGDSGTLTVTLPEFCGIVQADAAIGSLGKRWRHEAGIRENLDTCHVGSSTTTTSTSSTTTTTTTTSTTTTTTTTTTSSSSSTTTTTTSTTTTTTTSTTAATPKVAGTITSTTSGSGALPFTAATTHPTDGLASTDATDSSQLPFTGANIGPMILIGIALVLLGGLLITTVESRRRMLRRAAAIRMEHVKEGARRTSDWFLGL